MNQTETRRRTKERDASRPGRAARVSRPPVRVKLCGFTRVEDAAEAERLGADSIGLNFWRGSKRYVSTTVAARIVRALSPFVLPVGVFVNATREDIERVVARTGIRAIQLHGDEPPRACRGYSVPVIKALPMGGALSESTALLSTTLDAFPVDAFLFDTATTGHGGSGRTFDWQLLRGLDSPRPFLLAGGLHPGNVAEAVRRVRPYGVDVASGVESAPGIKDSRKMKQFIERAKEA